jgi:hypothetical protein
MEGRGDEVIEEWGEEYLAWVPVIEDGAQCPERRGSRLMTISEGGSTDEEGHSS